VQAHDILEASPRARRRADDDDAKKNGVADRASSHAEGRAAATGMSVAQTAAATLFNLKTPDDVLNAWLRFLIKKALPLDSFDDPLFRRAVATTARCGGNLLTTTTERVGSGTVVTTDVRLPHRTFITETALPAFDTKLDTRIKAKIQAITKLVGNLIISDGWSSGAGRPIINALASSPAGSYFIKALDTSGSTKDAKFIADFINKVIDDFGPDQVTAVCMDGACKSSFSLIEDAHPHVATIICPTHSLDNFLKNVGSDQATILVRGHAAGPLPWGATFFSEPFTKVKRATLLAAPRATSAPRACSGLLLFFG
jgi:hypothetical protein